MEARGGLAMVGELFVEPSRDHPAAGDAITKAFFIQANRTIEKFELTLSEDAKGCFLSIYVDFSLSTRITRWSSGAETIRQQGTPYPEHITPGQAED
jgi:hypothetical protein